MSSVRAALSVLVAAAGTFIVAACVFGLVVVPLRVAENPPPDVSAGSTALALFLVPLVLSTGLLVGLLLIWSGMRGTLAAADPGLWRRRQRPALWGCGIGVCLAVFVLLFGGRPWVGLSPSRSHAWAVSMLVFYSVIGFLLILVLSLQGGRLRSRHPANGDRHPHNRHRGGGR